MKVLNCKWMSVVFFLPLLVATFTAKSADAEQIARSRSITGGESRGKIIESTPSVTDLNLTIPVEARLGDSADISPSNQVISTSDSSTIIIRDQSIKFKATIKPKNRLAATNSSAPISTIAPTVEQQNKVKIIPRRKNLFATNIETNIPTISRDIQKKKFIYRQKIAAISAPPLSGNYLRLVKNNNQGTNDVGNPIYTLEAYVNGELRQKFNAISGTANSQKFDRNIGNNHAPLPDGLYHISDRIVPGAVPEVGKTFIGIYPQFPTNRSDLGIHLDPSFNKRNGYDGTSGCVGLTAPADRDAINEFVNKYRPKNLFVNLLSSAVQD